MFWGEEQKKRLKSHFKKTFSTPEGRDVLMYLYENLHGKQPTNTDGNAITMAVNEGKRTAWLIIMEMMREEDIEMRAYYEEYVANNMRENMMRQEETK